MTTDGNNSDHTISRTAAAAAIARRRFYARVIATVIAIAIAVVMPRVNQWMGADEDSQPSTDVAATSDSSSAAINLDGVRQVTPAQNAGTAKSSATDPNPDATAEAAAKPGELIEIRTREFRSTAGLLYVPGSQDGHRLDHVMEHSEDDPDREIHGVFEGDRATILANIDNAYSMALSGSSGVHRQQAGDRIVYTVDLGRRIGFVGGKVGERKRHPACHYLRLVLQDDSEVITAYPTNRPN